VTNQCKKVPILNKNLTNVKPVVEMKLLFVRVVMERGTIVLMVARVDRNHVPIVGKFSSSP
jgi:hypothetical protein